MEEVEALLTITATSHKKIPLSTFVFSLLFLEISVFRLISLSFRAFAADIISEIVTRIFDIVLHCQGTCLWSFSPSLLALDSFKQSPLVHLEFSCHSHD